MGGKSYIKAPSLDKLGHMQGPPTILHVTEQLDLSHFIKPSVVS